MTKLDILNALAAYDAGQPRGLQTLSEQLSTEATMGATAVMAISQNKLDERELFLSNANFHGYLTAAEMLRLAATQPVSA